nr:hypothetical protein [Tanacetum cinerariifolium]
MKMEHYLSHTDYLIWQVIQNGNGPVSVTTDKNRMIKVLPPKTTEEVVARERERKARTTLLMALLEDHLAKFHKMADAKEMWEDIKSRFGGNDDSKARDNGRRPVFHDDSKALVTINGEDIDWAGHVEEDTQNFAMMAYSSSNSGSDNETSADESNSKPVPKPVVNESKVVSEPKAVCEPKVWTDAPIIEEYESDCDDDPHKALKDKGIVNSGCSRHMTGNKAHLADYQELKVAMLPLKDKILFIDTDCLVLSPDFNLPDENQVLLKIPRQHNMYSFNLKNIDPSGDLSFLFAKASIDESNKWHRRLGHVNFKNLNKLVKGNLDETTPILKDFIRQAENQFNHKVKIIRSDNETKFKNHDLIELCGLKGIKREYSNARTPQQNEVAERKNRTLIEAARTLVLVTKPQNKIPCELLIGRKPIISYLKPFGCHVTILNTIDQLGKFDGKFDLGFLVGYSLNSKAFTVYNLKTKRVEENLHVNFLENKTNVAGKGHAWMFDLDYLTKSMKYKPVSLENQANKYAGLQEANNSASTQVNDDQGTTSKEIDLHDEHFILPIWSAYSTTVKSSKDNIQKTTDCKTSEKPVSQVEQIFQEELEKLERQEKEDNDAVWKEASHDTRDDLYASPSVGIFTDSSYDGEGVVTEFNNLETMVIVSPTPTTRIHTIHPKTQILGDPLLAVQTRSKVHKNLKLMLLSLKHWKMKVGLMLCKRNCCSSKFKRIEAIRIFLAFSSYMGFIVYQMDVKSAFLYGTIDEEVYVTQPLGFVDPKFPNKKEDGIFISQDKYVAEILKKFDFLSVKTASTPIKTQKPLVKDEKAVDVVVHLYRSMIGSLMYLTASRPDIMFAVCACSRFQVTPKTSHLQAVKRIFRKSTTGGCQFLGRRLISW